MQTALLSEKCQRVFGPCFNTSQYCLDFILVWNSIFTPTFAQGSFTCLFISYFLDYPHSFYIIFPRGTRCFSVRCFLERRTLCPGLLGTVLIYASYLCVIIYCSFLLIQCFFTIHCLHLDDKICDHLPYVVLYSSRT